MGIGCVSKICDPDALPRKYIVEAYAQSVKDFSSEYADDKTSYAVQNIAGCCQVFPKYGDFELTGVLVSDQMSYFCLNQLSVCLFA